MTRRLCYSFLLYLYTQLGLLSATVDVYFGTGGGQAHGIYHAVLDVDKGKLSEATLVAAVQAPEFLAFHPDRTKLYAVAKLDGQPSVVAYAIAADGSLSLLNSEPIVSGGAAHISVHPSGRFLLTAQYGAGSVELFPLAVDGHVQASRQVLKHVGGSGVVAKRQNAPHPHWTGFSPDGRFAFVPDLGLDQIVIYKVQSDAASIQQVGHADSIPGGGPRHMRFSVDGQYIFLLNELSLTVSTFAYDAAAGTAKLLSSAPTLSDVVKAKENSNSGSEILVHPNGQFVYAANRGHDSVTAFKIEPASGQLQVVDVEPIRGAWPRSINIDSSGRWLLAAGAHSGTVTVLAVDPDTGELSYRSKSVIQVPNAICVLLN
ncbi:lactonase family protein [Coraliomargarita algicola]|uniref:Lactonase family protein n=1 Tax=Coraliomargarita algicola TaxID=3092156 RepID=A0ABZ0RHP2_9BACT|nr:lactonase family protein [Coraliomargarita sp. J2-16]WPJ94906.1 lactonase family protein [Coraliomargarita sp. J2-16]